MSYTKNDGLRYYFQKKIENKDNQLYLGENLGYEFPEGKTDWLSSFMQFEKFIEKYHENVNLGIAISGDGLLTDHGVEHINSVMRHVVDIIVDPMQLTGYEMYILMFSIHFHDLGNISGRSEHEKKIGQILASMGNQIPLSTPQRQIVKSIAMAHGGYIDGERDTIKNLNKRDSYGGSNIRPQMLAAILRFADEISDDLNRSDFSGIDIPKENKLFHDYSKALAPVTIAVDTIILRYDILFEQTQNKIWSPAGPKYLYDEILDRLAKMIIELEYCKKYSEGKISISTLDVEIHITDDKYKEIEVIPIRLTLQGYPDRKYAKLDNYISNNLLPYDNFVSKYRNGKKLKEGLKK